MPKEEWGTKHRCEECGAKFYDLMRETVACPACGAVREPPKQDFLDDAKRDAAGPDDAAKDAADAPDVDDDILEDADIDLDDDVLDDDAGTVPLEDIKNVSTEDES